MTVQTHDPLRCGPTEHRAFRNLLDFAKGRLVAHKFVTQAKVDRAKWVVDVRESSSWGGAMGCTYNISGHFFSPNLKSDGLNPYKPNSGDWHSWNHCQVMAAKGYFGLREYARYWNRTGIGNFYSKDLKEVMLVLICHELAHFVNYSSRSDGRWYGTDHNAGFRRTYFAIRQAILADYREKTGKTILQEISLFA